MREPSPAPASLPLGTTALAAAGLILGYWILARTPIQHVSPGAHELLTVASAVLVLAAILEAGMAAVSWIVARDVGRALPRWAHAMSTLPRWAVVAPTALSASYVAARISLTTDVHADYWPAFALWLASMALFIAAFVPGAALHPHTLAAPRVRWRAFLAPEALIVVALTGTALVLRVVHLDSLPPLVHGDEEAIGFDALRAADGQLRNMFGAAWGANPAMGFFIYGGFIKLFGASIHSMRLGSAVLGAASIPAVYLLLRSMFGKGTALAGAVFLVGYHQHLHFSRVGINVVWDAPAIALALFFAYRASRDERPADFAATGLVSGAALYLYHGTRATPVVVLAYLAYVCVFRWRFARANALNFVLLAVAFMVAATPIVVFYMTHQHVFWARLDQASIFQSGWFDQQRELGHSPATILWAQTRHAFGGWFVNADASPFVLYSPSKPLVVGLAVLPLLAGIAYSALHIDDRRYALLLIAFALPTFLGGALTMGPPNAQRLVGAMPAVVGLIAVGLWESLSLVLRWRRGLVGVAAVAMAAALATADARTYFDGAHENTRWGGLSSTVAARYLRTVPAGARIYWYGAPEVRAMFSPLTLHDLTSVEVFDSEKLPEAQPSPSPSVFVFLAGYAARMDRIRTSCAGGTTRRIDFLGTPVLEVYELMTPNICVPAPGAPDRFVDAIALPAATVRDYTVPYGATIEPGEPLPCGMAGNTVWYSFTSKERVRVVADTNGSSFDTVLAVYTGDAVGALTPVTCNDDLPQDDRSGIHFDAEPGSTYRIQIGRSSKAPSVTPDDVIRFNVSVTAP